MVNSIGYAEFEEKDFEEPLYNQLENGERDVWTPGQCLEEHIGIDFSGNMNSCLFRLKGRIFIVVLVVQYIALKTI